MSRLQDIRNAVSDPDAIGRFVTSPSADEIAAAVPQLTFWPKRDTVASEIAAVILAKRRRVARNAKRPRQMVGAS